jgi:O-antigen/teichoic acid export membrane protein
MTGLPQMLNLRLDQMLLAAFLPPRELGLYVVAVAWSGAVSPLLGSIGTILLPSVASSADHQSAVARIGEGVRMTALLAIGLCGVTAVATPFAIPMLFGTQFRVSTSAALILVPAAGILGLNFSLQEGLRGLGFPYPVLRAELLGLVVTAISLAVFLRPFGIVGAAMASLLGYLMVTISMLASARWIAGASIVSLIVPRVSEVKRSVLRIAAMVRADV